MDRLIPDIRVIPVLGSRFRNQHLLGRIELLIELRKRGSEKCLIPLACPAWLDGSG